MPKMSKNQKFAFLLHVSNLLHSVDLDPPGHTKRVKGLQLNKQWDPWTKNSAQFVCFSNKATNKKNIPGIDVELQLNGEDKVIRLRMFLQNPDTDSEIAKYVQSGHKLMWIANLDKEPPERFLGKVLDGKFSKVGA